MSNAPTTVQLLCDRKISIFLSWFPNHPGEYSFLCLYQELENYRSAMCKMAEDILALRSQVASLEEQNSQLRSELSMNQDLGRTLLDDTDIDVMTKAEIADRIGRTFSSVNPLCQINRFLLVFSFSVSIVNDF